MNYVTLLYLLPHSIYTTKRFQMDSKKHNIGLTHANKHLPRLAIIGAGSIGLLFYHLLKSSHRFDPFFIEPSGAMFAVVVFVMGSEYAMSAPYAILEGAF